MEYKFYVYDRIEQKVIDYYTCLDEIPMEYITNTRFFVNPY